MPKRILLSIFGCCLTGAAIVCVLYFLSDTLIHHHNNFIRQFPPHTILEGDTLDIQFNSYYIAGGTSHHLYLGNYTAPLYVLQMNSALADTQHFLIKVKNIEHTKFRSLKLKVDSPNFYLADGTVPVVYSGKVNQWQGGRHFYDSVFFIESTPIGPATFAIKGISSATKEHELGKVGNHTPHLVLHPEVLEKQIDGRFCVDGALHFDKETNRLVYLYFYRNQYSVMDTNLNLLYRGNTIDTMHKAKLKIAAITSDNSENLAAPPFIVNKYSCVAGDLLLVNSNLLAKNEDPEIFARTSVIDVYSLKNRTYKFSFYIPDFRGKKLKGFRIFGKRLFVLFDHFILSYPLQAYYFSGSGL